ncbi:signal peptidase I [Bacillus sp. CGMCC 1.16607]|uniref:signal peptidase I n=1 Tax=Bacillus sp. CGMCC 1.16607 TaxID=3351842 RepID=UPI0036263CAA
MIKKVIKWIGNILIGLLVILSISSLYSMWQSKNNPGQFPTILGYKVMTVLTGSMEPLIKPGDLIVVKSSETDTPSINDVITYRNSQNTPVTHRIVEVVHQDGEEFFITQGDANNVRDEGLVSSKQIVGSLFFSIPKVGSIATFMKSSFGLMIVIAIPLFILTIGVIRKIFTFSKEEQESEIKI